VPHRRPPSHGTCFTAYLVRHPPDPQSRHLGLLDIIYFINSRVQLAASASSMPPEKRFFYSNALGAPDLRHRQLRPPHRMYSTKDCVHRTGSTPSTTASSAPDLLHRRPRPPHRISITDSLVRLARNAQPLPPQRGRYSGPIPRCNVFLLLDVTYMLVSCAMNFSVVV
jgi:hypothetical protein